MKINKITRPVQLLELCKRGYTLQQAAAHLGISFSAAKSHIYSSSTAAAYKELRAQRQQRRVDYVLSLVERGLTFNEVRVRLKATPQALAKIYTSHAILIRTARATALHQKYQRAWGYYLKHGTILVTAAHFGVSHDTIARWFKLLHGDKYRSRAAKSSVMTVVNEYLEDKHLPPHKLRELREWVVGLSAEALTRDVKEAATRPFINERTAAENEARFIPLMVRMNNYTRTSRRP